MGREDPRRADDVMERLAILGAASEAGRREGSGPRRYKQVRAGAHHFSQSKSTFTRI